MSSGCGQPSPTRSASTRRIPWPPGTLTLSCSVVARVDLTERSFDRLHFRGPGTDLTIGLHPGNRWYCGATETAAGRACIANRTSLIAASTASAPDVVKIPHDKLPGARRVSHDASSSA